MTVQTQNQQSFDVCQGRAGTFEEIFSAVCVSLRSCGVRWWASPKGPVCRRVAMQAVAGESLIKQEFAQIINTVHDDFVSVNKTIPIINTHSQNKLI